MEGETERECERGKEGERERGRERERENGELNNRLDWRVIRQLYNTTNSLLTNY